jgi:Kef-type K+ transport system membrane component KefB
VWLRAAGKEASDGEFGPREKATKLHGFHLLQVVITLAAVAYAGMALTGGALGGPGAIILGGGLALSTTAVGMQVRWVFSSG